CPTRRAQVPDYSVMQNRWVFVALLWGGGLVLAVTLTYWAMWRPRWEEREVAQKQDLSDAPSFLRWLIEIVPWALILAIAGVGIYVLAHTLIAAHSPPNW
ncbi:MAG TPA: hypothetical protein VNX25_10100, partial [Verrucomicrobiae bacterium]|nr:hypothetical protein [Verrucomicrobiae bacterium]